MFDETFIVLDEDYELKNKLPASTKVRAHSLAHMAKKAAEKENKYGSNYKGSANDAKKMLKRSLDVSKRMGVSPFTGMPKMNSYADHVKEREKAKKAISSYEY